MNRRAGKFAFFRKVFFGFYKKIKLFSFKIFHFFVHFRSKNFEKPEILAKNIPLEFDFRILLSERILENQLKQGLKDEILRFAQNDNGETLRKDQNDVFEEKDDNFEDKNDSEKNVNFDEKLCFEFGHGNGEWLVNFAKKFEKSFILGCELQNPWFRKSVKKIELNKIKNAKVCKFDGVSFLEFFIKKSSLDAIFINFPDPWHKNKHKKRRVFTESFWKIVFLDLKKGGKIYFLSDNFEIFEFAFLNLQNFSKNLKFEIEKKEVPKWYPESKYFRKWREAGKKDFFYFEARKF